MKIQHVPLQHAAQTWELVHEYLAESQVHAKGDYSLEQIKLYVLTGQWMLLVSTDDENKEIAFDLKTNSKVRLAYLGKTFASTEDTMKELTGKPGAKCPENMKSIPLISSNGSACVSCGLCVYGKADIRFSASKK